MHFIASLILILITSSQALAAPQKSPMSLTLSGGVSLASYESGFLYYLTKQAQGNQIGDLKIVTGASAGSINGVIAIVNACQGVPNSPKQSLNWRVWTPLGIKDISDPSKVTALSLFSREGVSHYSGLIQKEFMAGLVADCEVVIGFMVTRKTPLKVEIKPGLSTDRHNEFFLVKIKGHGKGQAPTLENFPLNEPGTQQLFLPFGNDATKNYALLESVFVASAQFPLAFPPFTLKYCDLPSTSKKDSCIAKAIKSGEFIDGGIFNNTPVSIATTVAEQAVSKAVRKKLIYGVITLDGGTHPQPQENQKEEPAILKYMMDLLYQFTDTSRNRSVSEIYLNKNGIVKQTISNDKFFPRSSQYYVAFSGFLDKGFREYDFYLGMYEARHFLKRFMEQGGSKEINSHIESRLASEFQNLNNPDWTPYFCFLEKYDQEPKAKGSCDKLKGSNYSILFQVNADIVKNRCSELTEEAPKFKSCAKVKHLTSSAGFEKNESDQKFFYRRLEELKYPYEVNGGKPASGEDLLRTNIEPLFKVLVKKQPRDQGFLMWNATSILLNTLDFKPQAERTVLGLGSHIQIERNNMIFGGHRRPWFFTGYGLMVRGVDTYLNSNPDAMALGPFVGLTTNWTDKSLFWLEPEVGVRTGYNYSFKEDRRVCEDQNSFQASLYCRSAFVQPHISVSILGRVRIELGSIVYLDKHYKNDFTMLAEVQF